jgi:hypothetical protein
MLAVVQELPFASCRNESSTLEVLRQRWIPAMAMAMALAPAPAVVVMDLLRASGTSM